MRALSRKWLIVFYTLDVVALSVWIGGLMLIIAAVIPAVFNTFGMEMGGRFLSRVFRNFNHVMVVATVILNVSVLRIVLTEGPGAYRGLSLWECTISLLMLVLATTILFSFDESVQLQEQAFAIKDEAQRKAAYEAFFKKHYVVRMLYVVNLGLAIALIPVKVIHWLNIQKVAS